MTNLVAIVAVDKDARVQCQQPGCGHSVYRRIHIVQDGPELLVLGSTCFAKRYGSHESLGAARHGGGEGRQLTDEERQLLLSNTAALIARFEAELQDTVQRKQATRADQVQLVPRIVVVTSPPSFHPTLASPWPWMKPRSSLAYFQLDDGTAWVRVLHADGTHKLAPWPKFEGWDESLPARLGAPDPELGAIALQDVISAVAYLRGRATWEKVGIWSEIRSALAARG